MLHTNLKDACRISLKSKNIYVKEQFYNEIEPWVCLVSVVGQHIHVFVVVKRESGAYPILWRDLWYNTFLVMKANEKIKSN